jgi:RNA-directed DNA polymerase
LSGPRRSVQTSWRCILSAAIQCPERMRWGASALETVGQSEPVGPHTKVSEATSLYKQLRTRRHLKRAWQVIRANATSKKASRSTRALAQRFSDTEDRGLERISEQLRTKTFVFPPARGIAIKKDGKSTKRPLVVFDIESRIVQRALLDVVKEIPAIRATLHSGFNFGGVDGDDAGVEAAVMKAKAATTAYSYFIRSDIKAFFDSVTRDERWTHFVGQLSRFHK